MTPATQAIQDELAQRPAQSLARATGPRRLTTAPNLPHQDGPLAG